MRSSVKRLFTYCPYADRLEVLLLLLLLLRRLASAASLAS
jgi:hypothetical protein